ncbi:acetoacetate-CoA ligase [Thozetella sp. PMI_491]|nr:acetoacetate-CoA ligase [Thozetella sp. PMI_491]
MASPTVPRKLWEHRDPKSTNMWKFIQAVNQKHGKNLQSFEDLFQYSVAHKSQFWAKIFEDSRLIHDGPYRAVVDESLPIDAIPRWFEGVAVNFAENLLYSRAASDPSGHRGTVGKEDGVVAATEVREGNTEVRHATWGEIRRQAGRLASALQARGVTKGDRVVLVGGNSIEALEVYLATTWVGGIFSSSSTDMGTKGILQRTVQVNPKFLFYDDGALYNGKIVDLRSRIGEVVAGLRKDCSNFLGAVTIPRWAEPKDVSHIPATETLAHFLQAASATPPPFTRIAFHDPFLICYSSGTTGIPKAIVHSVGGVLLNIYKEGSLHEGTGPDSVTLQYTTTGWIMYLSNITPLLYGARIILYDGSPFMPDPAVLVRVAAEQKATKLGISPRWMFELAKRNISPREIADISRLSTVTSTGMVLSEQLFEWFYDKGFPAHTHLGNISGGTDLAGCFGIMNPLNPVYVGGCQGPSLGVDIAVYDSMLPNGPGQAVPDGTPGELVAVSSFPNVPRFLWGDKEPAGAPGTKFHSAYFARFDHVWAHGDFIVVDPVTKAITFLGRADGVLNPSGVRFGSAEIYSVIERHFSDRVQESLCVGQRRPQDNDESVMLFLLMRPGQEFDRKLVADVKDAIRRDLSKRHVPKYVFETPEIPTTVNLKKVELPVKQIVSGRIIKPSGTLANPESLNFYYQFAKVEQVVGAREKL